MNAEVAVLLLSEDSSKWAFGTLEQLCRRMFDWLTPQYADGEWLRFEPVNALARKAMTANMWKSANPRDYRKLVDLCKAIANHVVREDGFVFCHVDGDVIWGTSDSHNVRRFDAIVRAKVRDIVRGHFAARLGDAVDTRVEQAMTKLIAITPHYSIETWLFANTVCLKRLGVASEHLDIWAADLTALDGASQPKRLISVSTQHYPTLAAELHTPALLELQSSFADTLSRTGACGSLVCRLRHHWPSWVRSHYGWA